jgi:hypothetical protein
MGFYKKARSFVKQYMGIRAGKAGKAKGAGDDSGDLSLDLPSMNSLYNFIHICVCCIRFEERGNRKEEREKRKEKRARD